MVASGVIKVVGCQTTHLATFQGGTIRDAQASGLVSYGKRMVHVEFLGIFLYLLVMKFICWFYLPVLLVFAGCSNQPESDWYDQSVQHTDDRDQYIDAMVDAGMTPEEARKTHDHRVWEMNTINMTRQDGEPVEVQQR